MITYINLQFFKGGSSTQKVDKRDPKSAELVNMDSAVYNMLSPIATRYGGISMPSSYVTKNSKGEYVTSTAVPGASGSTTKTPLASPYTQWGGSLLVYDKEGNVYDRDGKLILKGSKPKPVATSEGSLSPQPLPAILGSDTILGRNFDIADEQAAITNANILNLLQTTPEYLNKHAAFMENGTDAGFEKYLAASEQAIANAYAKNVGTDLNNMAAKGILNSSVTNRALANQQAETGNAIAANRNQAANNWMSNYLSGYNTGMDGLKTMAGLPTQYYQNALAPIMPFYNYWKDMTDAYYGHEDYDTVVSSGGK